MNWRIKLINLLKEKNMTQKDLAELSGTNESTLSRALTGEVNPSIRTIRNITKALNITTDWLFSNDDEEYTLTTSSGISINDTTSVSRPLTNGEVMLNTFNITEHFNNYNNTEVITPFGTFNKEWWDAPHTNETTNICYDDFDTPHCSNCEHILFASDKFCPWCGRMIVRK